MILAIENFTFKIGNNRVVENISSEKIGHDLLKTKFVWKIGKK